MNFPGHFLISMDRRTIDFIDEQNHSFLENEKSKIIFIFNIKKFLYSKI